MQTSYLFISSYKSSIAKLDKEVLANARQQQQQQQVHQRTRHADEPQPQPPDSTRAQTQGPQYANPRGEVEYRKRIQRFRQFLAEEEKFWTLLVQRMYRTFGLTEAQPALVELGLFSESQDGTVETSHPNSETGDTTHPNRGRFQNGRNHFQFPPENPDSNAFLPRPEDRGGRLTIFSKALVCLGDIARYRELYNDSNGRPRAGHESMTSSRRKNRRGQEVVPRARNYDKAQRCYEQARALVPNEGNPWHQLAILSTYQKDTFSSVIKHYRALCVQLPYDTAMDNLNLLLTRTLNTWKRRSRSEREKVLENGSPSHVVFETFRERIIALHALWRIGAENGIERMDSISCKLDQLVQHDFNLLVSQRHLLPDVISQVIVLSESAFCINRMIRPKADRQLPASTSVLLDWRIIRHIFDLHSTLLDVGTAELAVPPPSDVNGGETSLALKITAVFRRTLPGLRIASKWIIANHKTILQDPEFVAWKEQEQAKGIQISKESPEKISGYSVQTIKFWDSYIEFIRALMEAFPRKNLPALVSPLDEDLDMRGFLPLKKSMGGDGEQGGLGSVQTRERPHPNAEQLMRIHDLLEDARRISELPHSPVRLVGRTVILNQGMIESVRPRTHPELADIHSELMENTPPTEEDVVKQAIEAHDTGLLDQDFDDEEEIVYMQSSFSPVLPPAQSPVSRPPPVIPTKSLTTPSELAPKSPMNLPKQIHPPPPAPHIPQKTAADLLNDVMSGVKNDPQPSRFKQSIWAASSDEQSLKFAAGSSPKSTYQLPPQYHGDLSPTWTGSHALSSSHVVQSNGTGPLQPGQMLAQPSQLSQLSLTSRLSNQYHHQRVPSLPSSTFQHYSTSNQTGLRDSLPYSHLAQTQQQLPLPKPATIEQLPTSPFLPPQTMNSVFMNNGLNQAHASIPFRSPVTSPGHSRQASYGQARSPQQYYMSRPPVPGQPFTSLPQAW
ncbi:hypothetical protein AGABI1DRAFT_75950 [Agaricus bisporus var. burnettii JB137-S8]|uniref:DNA/RNA-binding domain-containing protein n=1 Tax=Agaricus bisporus var. burnettii (strain JB137-S8 / ATCC MYA-4627 / FGSC 10392) TaxID=597362 RepID=K5X5Y4_AGABU|nr:uncharacterized protein AGABI1DRAFT_75950 [Agaricus bisporus var. burnettii JB137-S8]EKM78372.1 hypothetical protein AGABI1DRAFT_75950 [Agaricus bisporus var. burnettii JB137-S8]